MDMAHCKKEVISVLVNNRCNMSCDYCLINKDKSKQDKYNVIDFEFAKVAIEDFFKEYPSRTIRFFAEGEPTCDIGIIKEIKYFAESLAGDLLRVELQTNGMFSKEVAEWIGSNVDMLWVSYDGTPLFQNKFRHTKTGGETAKFVENNIKYIISRTNVTLGVRATITQQSVGEQEEIVKYLNGFGVEILAFDPICYPVKRIEASSDINELKIASPIEFAKNFLKAWIKSKELGVFLTSDQIWNFDEPTRYACRACIPYPHLTPCGYVSACDMASSGNTPLKELIYGIYDAKQKRIEYYADKIRKIQARCAENMLDCQGCEILMNCAGYCVGEGLNETGSLFRHAKDEFCDAMRYLAKNIPLNAGRYPYMHP